MSHATVGMTPSKTSQAAAIACVAENFTVYISFILILNGGVKA